MSAIVSSLQEAGDSDASAVVPRVGIPDTDHQAACHLAHALMKWDGSRNNNGYGNRNSNRNGNGNGNGNGNALAFFELGGFAPQAPRE